MERIVCSLLALTSLGLFLGCLGDEGGDDVMGSPYGDRRDLLRLIVRGKGVSSGTAWESRDLNGGRVFPGDESDENGEPSVGTGETRKELEEEVERPMERIIWGPVRTRIDRRANREVLTPSSSSSFVNRRKRFCCSIDMYCFLCNR